MGTDHDTPTIDALFAPLQEAALTAYARTLAKGKPPRSPRALLHLAWLALLAWLGLGHLITEAHRHAAIAAACPPGRKPKDNEAQTNLLDHIEVVEDGRPGFFVSLTLLKSGTVRRSCGQFELSLWGCHVPATAAAAAVAAGWGVFPEMVRSTPGLRFLPPSVVALYLAGNTAALVRRSPPDEDMCEHDNAMSMTGDVWTCSDCGARFVQEKHVIGFDEVDGLPITPGTHKLSDSTEIVNTPWREGESPVLQAAVDIAGIVREEDGSNLTQADEDQPHHLDIVPPAHEDINAPYYDDGGSPECFSVRSASRDPIADLTIGDYVKFTSGPHAGRIAGVCEVSADKPKAQLVGRAVDVQDVTEVPGDTIDLIGEDPDEPSLKPSALTSKKSAKKSAAKRKAAKS